MLRTKINTLSKKGRTAVNYAFNMQSLFFRWRDDADYKLDNNFAERTARPIVLSHKTWLHYCSTMEPSHTSSCALSVRTCKLQGVGIINYMADYFKAVCGGRIDYENLPPGNHWDRKMTNLSVINHKS